MARTDRRPTPLGYRRRRQLGRPEMVWLQTLLHVARNQELQDARPRLTIALPDLRTLQSLPRRAPQARRDVMEDRRQDDSRRGSASDCRLFWILQRPQAA